MTRLYHSRTLFRLVRELGLAIANDRLAFTVCGGRLVDDSIPPAWLGLCNGCTLSEVVDEGFSHGAFIKVRGVWHVKRAGEK